MARYQSDEITKEAVKAVVSLMVSSARTAPKARGADDIQIMVVDGDDLETVAKAMEEQADVHSGDFKRIFMRDADNVRISDSLVLIGCQGMPKGFPDFASNPLDCGACGYKSCQHLDKARIREGNDFDGPVCVIQAIDFGIAVGSAVKMAMDLNVDNRIMYTVGAAVKRLKIMDSDVIMGIPVSVSGKNPFFDRKGGGSRALHNK